MPEVKGEMLTMTSDEILKRLMAFYRGYLLFPELRIGTGFGKDAEGYIDLWSIHPYPSKMVRTAFEIKVSREDFTRELRKPLKRRAALMISNEFYFAAPKGLITQADLPIECGLLEFEEGQEAFSQTVPAPWRDTPPASWRFVASLARRSMK